MANQIFHVNSASVKAVVVSSSLITVVGSTIDFTQASVVTGSFTGRGDNLTNVSASYIIPTANTTASNALSASHIIPGATLYVASGSDGTPSSYIEPFNIPVDPYVPPFKEGRMFYDSDFHNWVYYPDLDFKLHIGKEVIWRVHNPYNTTLPSTTVVYISGSSGESILPDVYKAIADGSNTKSDIAGLIRSDIPSGSFGYVLCNGVIHDVDVGTLQIGDQIWLSPTVAGGFVNADPGQPYESVRIGICQEAGESGSIALNIYTQAPPANAYAGMTSIPTFVDNTGSNEFYVGTATVNLYTNASGIGAIKQYPLAAISFSVPTSTTASFIYATTNGVTASYGLTSNFGIVNGISIVPVTTIYRADEDVHWMASNQEGLALANKIENRLFNTEKFAWESGFTLTNTGSIQYFITAGKVWFGATQISQSNFDSRLTESIALPADYYETHWAVHSASQWTIPTQSAGRYNNLYYDDGTNLVPLTDGYYCVNYFFRILGDNILDHDTFIVMSNAEYSSVASAENDTLPSDIPTVLSDVGVLVGRMIVQSSSLSASKIESAFSTQFGTAGAATAQHNNLIGLQGGTGGEYYHLTSTDYIGTGTGVLVRQNGAKITGSITTVSYVAVAATAQTASYVAAANIAGTLTATQAPIAFSASWVSASAFITTAQTASYVDATNVVGTLTATQTPIAFSASWVSASAFITTAQTASYVTASNIIGTVTSASYALSASYYPDIEPTTVPSASWVSASAFITTAQTASFVTASNVIGVVASASLTISASFAISASYAVSSSRAISASYAVSSSNAISSSYALSSSNSISASYAVSSSNAITSSYALTASYLTDYVYNTITSSNYTNVNLLGATTTPLSFSISPGETWVCDAYLTAQSTNNRGLRWAISSSATSTVEKIEGFIHSNTTALTAFASARITTVNAIIGTTVHTQANTPGRSQINFMVTNPATTTIISIGMAMLNTNDTGTAFAGSYLVAQKIR